MIRVRQFGKSIMMLIIVIISLSGCFRSASPEIEKKYTISAQKQSLGSIVTLPNIFLGVTKDDYDKLVKISVARDEIGLRNMILQRRAFIVEENTKAKIIDSAILSVEVRILDGSQKEKSGWISRDLIR